VPVTHVFHKWKVAPLRLSPSPGALTHSLLTPASPPPPKEKERKKEGRKEGRKEGKKAKVNVGSQLDVRLRRVGLVCAGWGVGGGVGGETRVRRRRRRRSRRRRKKRTRLP